MTGRARGRRDTGRPRDDVRRPAPPRPRGTLCPSLPITLNNGVEIPQLGFGVFQIEPGETAEATRTALEIGYRHIDTAQMYGNEKGVGEAVRDSGLDRGEVFVTSKVNNNRLDRDAMLASFDETPRRPRLRLPRPAPRPLAAAGRERLRRPLEGDGGDLRQRPGQGDRRLQLPAGPPARLFAASEVRPAVNQIEVQPLPGATTRSARSTPSTRS